MHQCFNMNETLNESNVLIVVCSSDTLGTELIFCVFMM